jgi:flagellar biosynthesis/type III secretory pathway protein FliH
LAKENKKRRKERGKEGRREGRKESGKEGRKEGKKHITNSKDVFENIKSVIKVYYEQLNAYKFNNLDELGQILKSQRLLKLHQEETDCINSPIFSIEFVI